MKIPARLLLLTIPACALLLTGCGTLSDRPRIATTHVERTALVLSDERGRPTDAADRINRDELVSFLRERGYLPEQYRLVDDAADADRIILITVANDGSYRIRSVLLNDARPAGRAASSGSYGYGTVYSYDASHPYYYDPYYWDAYAPPSVYYQPPIVIPPVIDRPRNRDHGNPPRNYQPGDHPRRTDHPRNGDNDGNRPGRRGRDRDGDGKPDRPPRNSDSGSDGGGRNWTPRPGRGGNAPLPQPNQPPTYQPPSYQPPMPTYTPPPSYSPPAPSYSPPSSPAPSRPTDDSGQREYER